MRMLCFFYWRLVCVRGAENLIALPLLSRSLKHRMLSSTLDGSPLPGVDMACNAMYLSLVGEMPEVHCPPGCTLQATSQGTIYVLDHIRRVGYPLQLSPQPNALPAQPVAPPVATYVQPVEAPATSAYYPSYPAHVERPPIPLVVYPAPPAPPMPYVSDDTALTTQLLPYKRSRASSLDSRALSSSHHGWERRHRASPDPSLDPTAPRGDFNDDDDGDETSSASPASTGVSHVFKRGDFNLQTHPQFCLIPPHPKWKHALFSALQLSAYAHPNNPALIFCHYCRTYFPARPKSMWAHLSQAKGHRVQQQRVRGYMVSGNRLLNTAEKRMLHVATPSEISSVPSRHFQHADRFQSTGAMVFVPGCVRWRSVLSRELHERIVQDGASLAEKVITREDLSRIDLKAFGTEPPELVGWRFLREGLDVVHCYCSKTNDRLSEKNIFTHHKNERLGN